MTEVIAYRLVSQQRAEDAFDGQGAWLFGGRWNSRGCRAVYVAESESLAILEVLLHLNDPYELEFYRLFQLTLPSDQVQILGSEDLPSTWREDPPPVETAQIGDEWLLKANRLALGVPSSVAIRDLNYLLNPGHGVFHDVTSSALELDFTIDSRLIDNG